MVNTGGGISLPVKNVMTIQSQLGPSQIDRKNQERIVSGQRRTGDPAERGGRGGQPAPA